MSTRINIVIDEGGLSQAVKEAQEAARQSLLEREQTNKTEAKASSTLAVERNLEGRDASGKLRSSAIFEKRLNNEEPAARRGGTSYYWLAVRAWWFDIDTFNDEPPEGKGLSDIGKVTIVRIQGSGGISASYETIGEGGNSTLNLLNGTDSSYDNYYTFPFLPAGTSPPSSPYLSQMTGPRKTLENAESGTSEYDPEKYTVIHTNQLPIFNAGSITFHKPFYNIYLETLDSTVVSIATQPKKFNTSGDLLPGAPANHGETFTANNSTLFDVGHAYLIGKYESGISTIKPRNTSNVVHVFIRSGRDRSGFYSLISAGASRFQVGDVVYWNNYSLYPLEPQIYRYGTITDISRGTFTYSNNTGGTDSVTGLRIILGLSENLTLDFTEYYQLFDSNIVKPFASIEEALTSPDALWADQFRRLGGFQNEWVTETIQGEGLGVPNLAAEFIGDSFLQTEKMDCSKNGKAYFIQSAYLEEDTPAWRRQENYHDGDFVAQRPGLAPEGNFQDRFIIAKFIELDCASNNITNTYSTTVEFSTDSNADAATIEAMPDWFPSKRYRKAGFYSAALNLNADETVASRISTSYDQETNSNLYFIKSWPLDQSLAIEEIVEMLFEEANATEVEITSSLPQMNTEIEVTAAEGPSRWGYTYTTEYLVSL